VSRRKGRIIAFQALYSWDVNHQPVEDILNFTWLEKDAGPAPIEGEEVEEKTEEPSESTKEEQTFASLIISGAIRNMDEINSLIEKHLSSGWSMDRQDPVNLAILRSAIYELKYQTEAQPGIVIDEAVDIAKIYGRDDSYKFINGILDKIVKDEKNS